MKVKPTLFISIGGTGLEIALRLRRRILTHTWGSDSNPICCANLHEFPAAQFIHYDLDLGTDNFRKNDDHLAKSVAFSESEKISPSCFYLDFYYYPAQSSGRNANIDTWLPVSPEWIKEWIDIAEERANFHSPTYRPRFFSRMVFYNEYRCLKSMSQDKLNSLLVGISNRATLDRLSLDTEPGCLRIVVLASTSGATGSGAFIDMGYLVKQLAKRTAMGSAEVALMLLLPGGFGKAYKTRCEANTYAALMELETCMGPSPGFVRGWSHDEFGELPARPYDNIFLLETANLAQKKTAKITDVFDMAADILFEDFSSSEFSSQKRSISANQVHHTIKPFTVPVDAPKYGSMKMNYSKAYSACGMAVIDTGLERLRQEIASEHVGEMLKAFFGVWPEKEEQTDKSLPTFEDGMNILKTCVNCDTEKIEISYRTKTVIPWQEREIHVIRLVDQLLNDGNISMIDRIHAHINRELEEILSLADNDQKLTRVDELYSEITHRVFDLEGPIRTRREVLFKEMEGTDSRLLRTLWAAVDSKENGGLDFAIQIIVGVKECIRSITRDLKVDILKFNGLWSAIKCHELPILKEIAIREKGGLFGLQKSKRMEVHCRQMTDAICLFAEAYLREVACKEATTLLKDLSIWLGKTQGMDARYRMGWSEGSLAGTLAVYRNLVLDIASGLSAETGRDRRSAESGNPRIRLVNTPTAELEEMRNLAPEMAMEMAKSVLDNLGGPRDILERLRDDQSSGELVGRLHSLALGMLPVLGRGDENPLIRTIEEMSSEERRSLFRNCLETAMPWVDANTEGLWSVNPIQYVCLVGVQGAQVFERKFGEEFRSALPVSSGITPHQIQFYESAEPGKLTCYMELSGMPLAALRQLPGWRASYDEESGNVPVHLHKDRSLFKHPLPPTSGELDRLAEHFSLFIQGIVFGVLTPQQSDGHFECLYYLSSEGQKLSIGNERLMRIQGVSPDHFPILQSQVSAFLKKAVTPSHLAGLAALYDYYAEQVYPPRIMRDDRGMEYSQDSFARVLCRKLAYEARQSLEEKSPDAGDDLIVRLKDTMETWTEVIEGSEADVYQYEVGRAHVAKRRVKTEFSLTGWLEGPTDVEPRPMKSCLRCGEWTNTASKYCPNCGIRYVDMPSPLPTYDELPPPI